MRKYILILALILCIALDLVSKYYFQNAFPLGSSPVSVIWDFLMLKLSYNPWIAFSLPIEWLPLQIITIGLILAIIFQYFQLEYEKRSLLLDISYILILAWWLSHAYERIFIGHVVDFIAVKYFAILNFADIFISVWVFLLIISYIRYKYAWKY
jgi:signal peptidase II